MEIQEVRKLVEKAIELLHKKGVSIRLLSIKDDETFQKYNLVLKHKYFNVAVAGGNGGTTDFNVYAGALDDPHEARMFPMLKHTTMVPPKKNTNLTDFDYVALCLAGWWYLYGVSYKKGK